MTETRTALVRRPSSRLAEGIVTHIERRPVDAELAQAQWARYVGSLAAAGWEIAEVAPAEACADAVFVEDTLVLYGHTAVVTRPGAESRRPEVEGAQHAVAALGYQVERIVAPGTVEGGDVLRVGDTVYVGTGGRTNAAGAEQLRRALRPLGATVVEVPLSGVLHLKSMVTTLPDGSIVGHPPLVPEPERFPRFVAVPEESGAHVVQLGGNGVLVASDCPRSAELFTRLGFEPVPVDIGEFQKREGCVTCLSVLGARISP